MQILCVIPARSRSRRLPDKPLRPLAGEPLIRHVARGALQMSRVSRIVVATDDVRVADAVAPLGVEAVLTRPDHLSGTDRVAEVARRLPRFDVIVNVQGDEPFLPPKAAESVIDRVVSGDPLATAGDPLRPDDGPNPHRVKVAIDCHDMARAFSRCALDAANWPAGTVVLRHVGVYAYERDALLRWAASPPTAEERAEGLEQLRPLAHGIRIGVARLQTRVPDGIDTETDLALAESFMERSTERAGR